MLPWFPNELRPAVQAAVGAAPIAEGMIDVSAVLWPWFHPRLDSLLYLADLPVPCWPPIALMRWKRGLVVIDGNHRLLIARLRGVGSLTFAEYPNELVCRWSE